MSGTSFRVSLIAFALSLFTLASPARAQSSTATGSANATDGHDGPLTPLSPETSSIVADTMDENRAINESDWLVAGSLSYESFKRSSDSEATSFFNINSELGYFVKRGLALGGVFSWDKTEGQDAVSSVGPMARWYFVQFPHSGIYLRETVLVGLTDSSYRVRWGNELGFDFFLNPHVAFGPSFRYTRGFSRNGSSNNYNDFLFVAGLSTFL